MLQERVRCLVQYLLNSEDQGQELILLQAESISRSRQKARGPGVSVTVTLRHSAAGNDCDVFDLRQG